MNEPVNTGDAQSTAELVADATEWIEKNCPKPLIGRDPAFHGGRKEVVDAAWIDWCEACYSRGWTVPSWPQEFGGAGLDVISHQALRQAFAQSRAPEPLNGLGVTLIGPAILEFGTPDQKRHLLPATASGHVRWCQGFSEPDAGSDLAAIRTTASLNSGVYSVNGTKMWTTHGTYGDWMFCLVRTDTNAPKREGLSMLVFPMNSSGIEVAPIELISGKSDFCQCFFDDLSVSASLRLGAEGQGWSIAKRILQFERSSVARPGSTINSGPGSGPGGDGQTISGLIGPYLELPSDVAAKSAFDALRFRAISADMRTRALAMLQKSYDLNPETTPAASFSIMKYLTTEATVERMEILMEALGFRGLTWQDGATTDKEAEAIRYWLYSKSFTIAGGASEVQLDIIAKSTLQM